MSNELKTLSGLSPEELVQRIDSLSPLEKYELDELLYGSGRKAPTFLEYSQSTLHWQLHKWQREHLVPLCQRFANERGLKILIHAPPQYGKSIFVSQRLPAYLMGLDPNYRVYIATQSVDHSQRFTSAIHLLMQQSSFTDWCHPLSMVRKNAPTGEFMTYGREQLIEAQPSCKALGITRGLVGTGPELLIMDDPYGGPKEALSKTINNSIWSDFYQGTVEPRLGQDSNFLGMFHRYLPDDIGGRMLATGEFEYYRFPAFGDKNEDGADPTGRAVGEPLSPRRSVEWLQKRLDKDPWTFSGQFQGLPEPPGGTLIRREWLKPIPERLVPKIDLWVRFWDLAVKKEQSRDFTAGALIGIGPNQEIYLKDMACFRAQWPEAQQNIIAACSKDALWCQKIGAQYWVGIEEVFWQLPMIQDLFGQSLFKGQVPLQPVPPLGDKKTRASGWIARAKYGGFYIVEPANPSRDGWDIQGFIDQAIGFNGLGLAHDDMVDGVSGAYSLTWTLRGGAEPEEPKPLIGTMEFYEQLSAHQHGQGDDDGYGSYQHYL